MFHRVARNFLDCINQTRLLQLFIARVVIYHLAARFLPDSSYFMLGPVNTSMIAALLPQIRPGKAREVKFGGSK